MKNSDLLLLGLAGAALLYWLHNKQNNQNATIISAPANNTPSVNPSSNKPQGIAVGEFNPAIGGGGGDGGGGGVIANFPQLISGGNWFGSGDAFTVAGSGGGRSYRDEYPYKPGVIFVGTGGEDAGQHEQLA